VYEKDIIDVLDDVMGKNDDMHLRLMFGSDRDHKCFPFFYPSQSLMGCLTTLLRSVFMSHDGSDVDKK
jgi:hypothetical protein